MVAVVFIDREHGIIPDRITLPGTLLGFACAPILGVSWGHSALGILLGAGWLLLVIGIYWLIRRVVGMGGGDVKLAAMLGAWLGWKGVFLALLLASFLGVLWGIGLILRKGVSARDTLPYGVFLGPVAAILLLLGSSL
jgi:leader peptidase (prepilin peptidase)/N-methyltransferase